MIPQARGWRPSSRRPAPPCPGAGAVCWKGCARTRLGASWHPGRLWRGPPGGLLRLPGQGRRHHPRPRPPPPYLSIHARTVALGASARMRNHPAPTADSLPGAYVSLSRVRTDPQAVRRDRHHQSAHRHRRHGGAQGASQLTGRHTPEKPNSAASSRRPGRTRRPVRSGIALCPLPVLNQIVSVSQSQRTEAPAKPGGLDRSGGSQAPR